MPFILGYHGRPGAPHQDIFDHTKDWLATLPHGNWILCVGVGVSRSRILISPEFLMLGSEP